MTSHVVVDRVGSDVALQQQPRYSATTTSLSNTNSVEVHDDANDWFLINTKNVCRACHSINSIRIDWSQGDRICTSCGVVQEERILDMNPEWRDYGDRDDRCNGNDDLLFGSNRARSGMIPTNEIKYIGGLQPTTLSRTVYNGTNGVRKQGNTSSANIAQRLRKVHRKIEHRMDQQNKVAMKNATLNLQLLRKRQRQELERREVVMTNTDADTENTDTVTANMNDDDDDDLPDYGSNFDWTEERVNTTSSSEYEHLIQEQEQLVVQQRQALHANKWSLDRAKQLFGSTNPSSHIHETNVDEIENDPILYGAAQDLFMCYTFICTACTTLQLPISIMDEAAALLCQYASRRDGLKVKGIASTSITTTVSMNRTNTKHNALMNGKRWGRPSVNARSVARPNSIKPKNPQELEEERKIIRQSNKVRQMASLCSGIVFWMARYRNKPRTILSVCDSIIYNNYEKLSKRHCSRALQELKECFPELQRLSTAPTATTQPLTSNTTATKIISQLRMPKFTVPEAICVQQQIHEVSNSIDMSVIESMANMIDHVLQKLHLPPVAEASIRYLVVYQYLQQHHSVESNEQPHHHPAALAKLIPLRSAAVAYMISTVGRTMQQLAKQTQQQQQPKTIDQNNDKKKIFPIATTTYGNYLTIETDEIKQSLSFTVEDDKKCDETMSFDLFTDDSPLLPTMESHNNMNVTPVSSASSSSMVLAEHRAYEMRRTWDAWSEQIPWDRSLIQIEQSTNVTRKNIVDYYKQHIYPDRFAMLQALRDSIRDSNSLSIVGPYSIFLDEERAILRKTPLSSVLLSNILVAAQLLKNDVKI